MAPSPRKPPPRKPAPRRAAKSAREAGSLERAVALLHAFIDGQEHWGVRELAAATGEPSSTTHRLLGRLRDMGFLEFDEAQRRYRVGFELYRICAVLGPRHRIQQVAAPILDELAASLNESAWLALFDVQRGRMAYIAERAPAQALRFPVPVGHEEPAWSEPSGWAVLAELPPQEARALLAQAPAGMGASLEARLPGIRELGYGVGPSALGDEAVVIAAPVHDAQGRPYGSLCVTVPRHRFDEQQARRYGIAVRDGARQLSYRMGATLLGGASTGSWHDAVSVISELLRRQSPHLAVTPARGGGQQNLEDLEQGRAAYCLTTAASLEDAFRGRRGFPAPHTRLRAVLNLSALYVHVFARRGIELAALEDLAGLRVSPGAEGFSSAQLFQGVLAAAGIKTADMRKRGGDILHFDYPEGQRQLQAGAIDVLFWVTGLDNPVCRELAASPEVSLIALPEAALTSLSGPGSGYRLAEIPRPGAGVMRTLKVPTVIATTADRPDDEVYRLAKVVYDNRYELAFRQALDDGAAAVGASSADVPMHPGAAKFWTELQDAAAPRAA
jgi:TRAP transporter TAXI family solute receptor